MDDLQVFKLTKKPPEVDITPPLLSSDNPIMVRTIYDEYNLIDEFFFPVSPDIIMFKILPEGYKSFQSLNSLIIHNSKRYVYSNDKQWLADSIELYFKILQDGRFSNTKIENYFWKFV